MPAGDYRLFRPESAQNRSLETGGQFAKSPPLAGTFCECQGQFLQASDWLAGDAVLIAPVSKQIPC
jgi:hypothetical protein